MSLERGKDTVLNQTLRSIRSQIESRRRLKDGLVVQFGQHFCQVGESQSLDRGISQALSPNNLRFLVAGTSDEALSSLVSS